MLLISSTTHAAPLDDATLKRLDACDAKVATIKDLTATFEQKKFSPLLKKPLVSRGTLRVRGDTMLWLTETPELMTMRIDAESLQLLYRNQKSLEVYPIKGKMASMAASPLPRLATLREKFDLSVDPDVKADARPAVLAVLLTPKDADLKPFVDKVRVTLDEATGVVRTFELTDPDGERTEITFADPKPNTGLIEADVALDVPPGTKTTRPLDTAAP